MYIYNSDLKTPVFGCNTEISIKYVFDCLNTFQIMWETFGRIFGLYLSLIHIKHKWVFDTFITASAKYLCTLKNDCLVF